MNAEGNQYDITAKELFAGSEEILISCFGGIDVKVVGELSIEFNRTEVRKCDLVVEGRTSEGPIVIHVEFQSNNDLRMHSRMLRYAAEIYDTYHLPVYQLVIYLGNRPITMADGISYRLGEVNRLDYRYRLVDLGEISYNEIKTLRYPHLYALLPLADREKRKKDPTGFLDRCAKEIVTTGQLDLEGKRKAILRAEILAGLTFNEKAINQIFREANCMLNIEESAGYQWLFKQAVEKGIKQGIEKGVEQGIERGLEKGLERGRSKIQEIVIKQLLKKFKELPEQYLERVRTQDTVALEAIADNIFDIDLLEDLDKYLS